MKSKVVMLIWCGVLAIAVRAGETSPRYANPVIPKNFPDPTFWTGDDGWVYGVATGPSAIHRSRDLVSWEDTKVPAIEPKSLAELKKFSGHFWAPDVAKVEGRYLLYITQFVSSERNRLVVLECERPTGPFVLRGVVLESWKFGKCDLGIDADVVAEGDSLWLFVGSVAGGVWRTKLKPDGLQLDEAAGFSHVAGLIPDNPNARGWIYSNRCYEGSYLYRRGKWWYLFVSCGSISGGSYKLCCGRSEALTGDFVDKSGKSLREGGGEVLLRTVPGSDFSGCGHNGEIFADRNGRTYMFVHSQWKGTGGDNWRSGPRCTSLQEVRWDDDGWPWFETGTLKGEETKPCYVAPAATRTRATSTGPAVRSTASRPGTPASCGWRRASSPATAGRSSTIRSGTSSSRPATIGATGWRRAPRPRARRTSTSSATATTTRPRSATVKMPLFSGYVRCYPRVGGRRGNELVLTKGVGDRPTFTLIMLAPCYGATEYEIETCVPYRPK